MTNRTSRAADERTTKEEEEAGAKEGSSLSSCFTASGIKETPAKNSNAFAG